MSQILHELCCALVDGFYGEFHAALYSILTHHGRYSATQLSQKARLPLRQVKAGLAVLVQNRLVLQHTTLEGTSSYQADLRTTYDLLRLSKLSELARRSHGDIASVVIEEASVLGFATVSELEQRTIIALNNKADRVRNDRTVHDISANSVKVVLQQLLHDGYLVRLRKTHLEPAFDARLNIRVRLDRQGYMPAAKGRKGQIELEEKIDAELRKLVSASTSEYGFTPNLANEARHGGDDDGPCSNKRRKLLNGSAQENGISGREDRMPMNSANIVVRLSYENVVAQCRNSALAAISKQQLGARSSQVLKAVLEQLPRSSYIDTDSTLCDIDIDGLYDSLALSSKALANGHQTTNGTHHSHEAQYDHDQILAQLAQNDFGISRAIDDANRWQVDKDQVHKKLRRQESLRIIQGSLAPVMPGNKVVAALRIIRMLLAKGKLDEKLLQEMGLLSAKDLRQTMAQLNQIGYVDLQEVPREAQKQPNRTMFLWFHDPERVKILLLENLYKAMTRILQRIRMEQRRLASTLEKADRFQDHRPLEDFMPQAEILLLRRWRRKEQWLHGEIGRLDDSVVLLRDLDTAHDI